MDDPVVLSDDLTAHLDDPVVHSDKPVVHSDEPVVHLNDPAVPLNDPVDDTVVGHSEEVGSESSNRGRKVSGIQYTCSCLLMVGIYPLGLRPLQYIPINLLHSRWYITNRFLPS